MNAYTVQIFLSNAGTDAKNRITCAYHVIAKTIEEAYEKTRVDFKNTSNFIGCGFILEGHYNSLPGMR